MTEVSRTTDAARAAAKRAADAAEAAAKAKQAKTDDAAKKAEPDTKKTEAAPARAAPAAPDADAAKKKDAPAAKTPAPSVDAATTAETQAKKGEEAQKKLGTAPDKPGASEPPQPPRVSTRTTDDRPERPSEAKRLSERIQKEPVEGAQELRRRVEESKSDTERKELVEGTKEAIAERMARMGELPDDKRKQFVEHVAATANRAGPEAARSLGKEIARRLDRSVDVHVATSALARSARDGDGMLLAATTANAMRAPQRNDLIGAMRARINDVTSKMTSANEASRASLTDTGRMLQTHGAHLSETEKAKAATAMLEKDKPVYDAKLSADSEAAKIAIAVAETTRTPELKQEARRFGEATRESLDQTKIAQYLGKTVAKGLRAIANDKAGSALSHKVGVGAAVLGAMAAQNPAEMMQSGAELGRGVSELAKGKFANPDFDKGLKSAATKFGALTSAAGALAAAVNASKGEWERAGLGAVSSAATGVSAWASAAKETGKWAGRALMAARIANPIGAAATLLQAGYEIYRADKNERAYQTSTADALKAAGFRDTHAQSLSRLSDKSSDAIERIAKETGRSRRDVINELTRGSERDQQRAVMLINRVAGLPIHMESDRNTITDYQQLLSRLRGPQPHPSL